MSYSMRNQLFGAASVVIGNSETETPVSETLNISHLDSLYINADVTCASTSGTPDIILQHSALRAGPFTDVETQTAVDGVVEFDLLPELAGDQSKLPLKPFIRFVVTTDGAGATTVSGLRISERRRV